MKACEGCNRVAIGQGWKKISLLRCCVAIPLIYVPAVILLLPLRLSASLVYWHLRLMGAENLKTLADFLPDRKSHRYDLKSQIVFDSGKTFGFLARRKIYWIFNCTYYCPYSVALLEWITYMTKIVENWWCPFNHARKENYACGAIDQSLWHVYPQECEKLHPDDRVNPIWNADAPAPAKPENV
jgi:hypothetical protein